MGFHRGILQTGVCPNFSKAATVTEGKWGTQRIAGASTRDRVEQFNRRCVRRHTIDAVPYGDDKATTGLSFANAFYAIRFDGLKLAAGRTAARLTVLEETTERVKLRVACKDDVREVLQDASKVARFDCPAK